MEEIWIYRSLAFAIIEYCLMILVLWKGRRLKVQFATLLFFLATYQLSEFLFFVSDNSFWLLFANFSNTFLPATGIWILEKFANKNFHSWIFAAIGVIFAFGFLVQPGLLEGAQYTYCTIKYQIMLTGGNHFINTWGIYYMATLITGIILAPYSVWRRWGNRKHLLWMLVAYLSFFPVTFILAWRGIIVGTSITSVMCALAIITAFITAWLALKNRN